MNNPDFTIIVDTREQQPWSFDHYSKANIKLDAGDYSIQGLQHLLGIERKKSVNEIANNITEPRFKDAIARLAELKYSFLLLEFDIENILNYPIGSNLPKRLWDKIKISPAFLMKHVLDWQLVHNINVIFCGDSSAAERTAEMILKKIYYIEKENIKHEVE
jgi:ERCC4-type nuclease